MEQKETMKLTGIKQQRIIEQIEEVLELLRPNFLMHGGDIQLVNFHKGILSVKLSGNCDGCPASNYTLKLMIETTMRKEVPQVKEVVEVFDDE